MNNLKKVLCDNNIKLKGLKKLNRVIILDTNKGKYVYKENTNNYDIYEYLKTRGFNYFPRCISSNSKGELVEYIDSFDIPREQKVSDLIHLSGILHRTTSFTREIDLDELSAQLGVPVVGTIARKKNTLNNLMDTILKVCKKEIIPKPKKVTYLDIIEKELNSLNNCLKAFHTLPHHLYRWISLKIIDGETNILESIEKNFSVSLIEDTKINHIKTEITNVLEDNNISNEKFKDTIVSSIMKHSESICKKVCTFKNNNYSRS